MQRILLIGGDGMLGSALHRVIGTELAGTHCLTVLRRAQFDITAEVWGDLPANRYDWVLNASGLTNRRTAQRHQMPIVNAAFPHTLAAVCQAAGTRLVQFSTDCVFDGQHGPSAESASADARDEYGRSKAQGEPPTAMTLRTSIIGPEHGRFYNLLCWTLRQDRMDGYRNHLWNGVTTVALARAVAGLIWHRVHQPGIRHVYAEDTTKHDLLALICRCFAHRAELRPVDALQPRDTRLCTHHPKFLASLRLPPLSDQVTELARLADSRGAWTMQ